MPPSHSTTLPDFDLQWIPNEHLFMFLIPKHPPFHMPLFDRLGFKETNLPVKRLGREKYVLDHGLRIQWISLKRNLRAIAFAMADLCTVPLPKFFDFWAFPKRFGYEVVHPSSHAVAVAAMHSRNAFLPLMATVTFLLIILNDREVTVQGFRWREKVLHKTGIHHQWLSALELSVVEDLSLASVGGIINFEQCEYKNVIPLLAKANLDIYLCWGDIDFPPERPLPFLTRGHFVPSPGDICHLHHLASLPPPPTEPSTSHHSPMPSTLSKNLNDHSIITQAFQPVEKYSGQKEGEHWNKFFHRQETKNEGRESHKTPQQKQSRLVKEKSAERHHPPGRKGARVFFWADDQCLGFCVRQATGYDRYQALWSNYNRSQQKYDSFSDEWDICTDFGDAGPDSNNDDFDDDEILEWFQGPSVSTGAPQQDVNSGGIVSAGDINNYGVPVELLPDDPELDHQEGEYSSTVDLIRIHGVYKDGEMPNNAPALNSLEDTALTYTSALQARK
jgi:hypothetical protein